VNRLRILAAALLLAALPACAFAGTSLPLKAGQFDPARLAPDFTLASSNGGALKMSSYRGKVVLLGFGFTTCPEVCPTTLATLSSARKKLGPLAKDVQLVYITVDPARDNAKQMHDYLTAFDPTFVGGTGSEAQLAAVRKDYGVIAAKQAGADGDYSHSSFVYLIDRAGRIRALMPFGHPAADYVHDVKILLAAQ
jgi:protein SCO1/2